MPSLKAPPAVILPVVALTMLLVTAFASVACAAGSQASTAECGYWRIEARNGAPDREGIVSYRQEILARLGPNQTAVLHVSSDGRPSVYMRWDPSSSVTHTEYYRNRYAQIKVSCAER